MDLYTYWQENNYFTIENNILKKKQTVFTNFIKVNQNGFINADFRSYLYADTLARYYRFKGYNVASTIGFDSLAYSSFLENTNKDMTIPFKEELEKLNVGYPKNKLIDNNDKTVVNLIQQIFLSLYNKDIIKYKDMDVYKEKEKIYDPIEIDGNRQLTKEKAFVLDYSKYLNRITNHLVNLSIENEYKEYLFTKLGAYDTLVINLETKNKKNIELYLQEPEELGALEAIIINPNHLDILEYIAPNEIFAVENFLIHQNKTYLYTGHQKGELPARNGLSDRVSQDLKKRGMKYMGSVTVYSHLQACGIINDHLDSCFRFSELLEISDTVRKRREKEQ